MDPKDDDGYDGATAGRIYGCASRNEPDLLGLTDEEENVTSDGDVDDTEDAWDL